MDQPKVAVIFHGASGALQGLAKEVAAGAEEEGAVVRVGASPTTRCRGTVRPKALPRPTMCAGRTR
jgi:hypothetical protein